VKKTILFVDDNDNVIQGLERQLRPFRGEWQLLFAQNAEAALMILEKQPIDLIVSDMLMPDMCGEELLLKVKQLYPATIRIIFSGYSDEITLKKALEVAHQYFCKPCNIDTLRESISQIFQIQNTINNPRIIQSIGDPNHLPSLPEIYQDINAAIASETTTIAELAGIFARDMVLSARLLQLVNSPYFGVRQRISSLSEAISMIGINMLNNLVLSIHIKHAFPVNNPKMLIYMEYLWQDAWRVAQLAKLISLAEEQPEDRPDQAYLGGLLHNMGLLVFLSRSGDQLLQFVQEIKKTDIPINTLEKQLFGFTHCEAAAYLLSLWKIPPRIIESVLLHTSPNESDYDGMNALTAVHAATFLLNPAEAKNCDRMFCIKLDSDYLQRINKLNRLPDWQLLAETTIAQFNQSTH
jgi:HD-like signal output (HDOD) protein